MRGVWETSQWIMCLFWPVRGNWEDGDEDEGAYWCSDGATRRVHSDSDYEEMKEDSQGQEDGCNEKVADDGSA